MPEVAVTLCRSKAVLPQRATTGSAGYDLAACLDAPHTLAAGERCLVPTGLKCALPPDLEAQVRPRSGLALKHGITVLNGPGTIDADYRGEIQVILINHGTDSFTIQPGMRIAQLVFQTVIHPTLTLQESLEKTGRGEGGFGHSAC